MRRTGRVRVWDLPTRIFHWAFAATVAFSFATGKIGDPWMHWHLRSGYAVLALLAFRVAWGFAGSASARFAHFLRGPRAMLAHARALRAGRYQASAGHNPLGGWMVVVLLGAVLAQAATGLFADDEIATQGPLAAKVSNAVVSRMSTFHSYNAWLVLCAVAVHVAAIAFYRWQLGARLVGPMVHGWIEVPPGERWSQPVLRPSWLALVIFGAAVAAVYLLVVVYPST